MSSSSSPSSAKLFLPEDDLSAFLAIKEELLVGGTKLTGEDLLALWQLCQSIPQISQLTLFLEVGNEDRAGWLHVLQRHENDLANFDIASPFRAINDSICGEHVASDDSPRGVLSIVCDDSGEQVLVFCSLGQNEFLVTAYSVGLRTLKRFFKSRKVPLDFPEHMHPRYLNQSQTIGKLLEDHKAGKTGHNARAKHDASRMQVYVLNCVECYLYVSHFGSTDVDLHTHEVFSDEGILPASLIQRFEAFNQFFHDAAVGNVSMRDPMDEPRRHLQPLDLAYSLKLALDVAGLDCQVYGEFDPHFTGVECCIEATGHNLRLARRVVIDRFLETITDKLNLEFSEELSSSHVGDNSSPRKIVQQDSSPLFSVSRA